jgi:hypothetical protein
LDDVCVKVNGLVGFMLDVDRDEVLFMRVYHQIFLQTIHRC